MMNFKMKKQNVPVDVHVSAESRCHFHSPREWRKLQYVAKITCVIIDLLGYNDFLLTRSIMFGESRTAAQRDINVNN